MRAALAWSTVATAALACAGFACSCSKRGPRDLGNQNPRSEFVDGPGGAGRARDASADAAERALATPSPTGRKPRPIANVSSRALVTDAARVYFGDDEDDTLCSLEKMPPEGKSNEPVRIARRAPVMGALALDAHDGALAWIASPGDIVLRVPVRGGVPTTIRDRGIFTNVAASTGDVFFTEARGAGGTLMRVTGTTAAQLATLEGTPRGIIVDADTVYVATSSRLLSSPRTRGEVTELARGSAFASPQAENGWLYATAATPDASPHARVIVRVKRSGGPLETIATNVRDSAIAVHRGALYWFDADRAALLSCSVAGDAAPARSGVRVVSEDPMLERVNALAVDDDGAFVATGHGEEARIVAISVR